MWLDWELFPGLGVEQRLSHLCHWALEFDGNGEEYGLRLPGVVIEPATGDKHRERAEQIGVQRYLGKPYQEADLLDSIHQIIGVTGEIAEA